MTPINLRSNRWILFISIFSVLAACKSENVEPSQLSEPTRISMAQYNWGDQSTSRQAINDIIKYNSSGKIDTVISTNENNYKTIISLTYQGNKIFLNTIYEDTYELDEQGRVAAHTSKHDLGSSLNNLLSTERYSYDQDGYLSKVTLMFNNTPYSVVNYSIKDGNYITYKLSAPNGNDITRKYSFSYNNTKVKTAFSTFNPVLSSNTFSNIDKYLNFGKQSVNQITSIEYEIINLDKSVKNGLLNVVSMLDEEHNIIRQDLIGTPINGIPSDNLSPMPRNVTFTLINYD